MFHYISEFDFFTMKVRIPDSGEMSLSPAPVSGVIPRIIIRSPLQGVCSLEGCFGSEVRSPVSVYCLLFTDY